MNTVDTTLLIIITTLLSILLILCIAAMVIVVKLLSAARRLVAKAEEVVDSVESAAEVLKDTSGPLALFKLVRNIVKMTQKRSKK